MNNQLTNISSSSETKQEKNISSSNKRASSDSLSQPLEKSKRLESYAAVATSVDTVLTWADVDKDAIPELKERLERLTLSQEMFSVVADASLRRTNENQADPDRIILGEGFETICHPFGVLVSFAKQLGLKIMTTSAKYSSGSLLSAAALQEPQSDSKAYDLSRVSESIQKPTASLLAAIASVMCIKQVPSNLNGLTHGECAVFYFIGLHLQEVIYNNPQSSVHKLLRLSSASVTHFKTELIQLIPTNSVLVDEIISALKVIAKKVVIMFGSHKLRDASKLALVTESYYANDPSAVERSYPITKKKRLNPNARARQKRAMELRQTFTPTSKDFEDYWATQKPHVDTGKIILVGNDKQLLGQLNDTIQKISIGIKLAPCLDQRIRRLSIESGIKSLQSSCSLIRKALEARKTSVHAWMVTNIRNESKVELKDRTPFSAEEWKRGIAAISNTDLSERLDAEFGDRNLESMQKAFESKINNIIRNYYEGDKLSRVLLNVKAEKNPELQALKPADHEESQTAPEDAEMTN